MRDIKASSSVLYSSGSPQTTTRETTTKTKEFDSKGRVVKEITVTEKVTETFTDRSPYYYQPTWTGTAGSMREYPLTVTNDTVLRKADDGDN